MRKESRSSDVRQSYKGPIVSLIKLNLTEKIFRCLQIRLYRQSIGV